ncbi:hypothetical protein KP509_06G052400 [Ceratopteris richardii]|uniref:non-specific serine/threonine protein kinase n=2 Tax=Ceratopteris richardii TaxID=49495 RepID=A0A8T2UMY3_CERRI|nr:hypothetical protein KP509_06G052400 [Ceratopteris richardii]
MGNQSSIKRPRRDAKSMDDGRLKPQPNIPKSMQRSLTVLNGALEDIREVYILGDELGRGQFGVTRICKHKLTGEILACKSISKRKLRCKEDVDDVRLEIRVLNYLKGHPNIVKLRGTYEDRRAVHIVMDLCTGGELFERIISKKRHTEREAAAFFRTIVEVLEVCHSRGVMHRDLKPENFLLQNEEEDSPLVIIDFGLSTFFKPGEIFRDFVGSAYYIAPEVVKGKYGPEADVWSAGVILYILLCGVPPFWAETEQGIFDAVLAGSYDLTNEPWPSISSSAKDLISKMLKSNPNERLTFQEVQNHPWVRADGDAPDRPLDNLVLTRMKHFQAVNKLKKLAFKVIAEKMSEEEIIGLKELFKSMDTDNSGTLSLDELKKGFASQGSLVAEEEAAELLNAADIDGNGCVDYMEFVAAMINKNKLEKEEQLVSAFQYFDTDNSGFITTSELKDALEKHNMFDAESITSIIAEVDTDKDGRIDYDEFVAMMRQNTLQE